MVLREKFFVSASLVLILSSSAALMTWSAMRDAAIMDELAHIPAGYGYVKYLDYRLNPEHPPMLKVLSALPLLFLDGVKFPENHKSWTEDINGQWETGAEFLYKSGNDADLLIFYARILPMILTLLTTILIFIWSREIVGRSWALLAAFLFALSPNVLAHGHYVTTDIAATFGVVFASYFFMKTLDSKSKSRLLVAGIAFGVAELMKFSTVLLIPYFLILGFVFAVSQSVRRWREEPRAWQYLFYSVCKAVGKTILVFLIGFVLVYAVYALFTINYPQERQVRDTIAILESFSPKPIAQAVVGFADNNFLRPIAEYFLGVLMVLQRSAGGNTNYFLGHVSASGSWYYFPLVYLLKEPLPILAIMLGGLVLAIKRIFFSLRQGKFYIKSATSNYFGTHFGELGMLIFIFIYWGWSMKSPLNIGLRHILPTLPFFYILAVSALKRWHESKIRESKGPKRILFSSKLIVLAAVVWLGAETAFTAPNFLSYFNEIGGGKYGGYKFVTDSNYDWGQDLKELAGFVEGRNNDYNNDNDVGKIAVDYFGGGSPAYYLGEKFEPWWSARGNPKDLGLEWLAVSVNSLQGAIQPTTNNFERKPEDEYRWLTESRPRKAGLGELPQPDFRTGTSIFIYKL